MHTAWQHTWRLYDAIATPHTAQGSSQCARSNVVLLPMAEQKESCIGLIQATFLQVYQSLHHDMVIFSRATH